MKVFVTGASGYVGSALVVELINNGHSVLGLARSEASAKKISDLGAEVIRGDLDNIQVLKEGAATCDGVAHTAFIHDFANFQAACETDRKAIMAICSVIKGTKKPLVAAFGTLYLPNDHLATEQDVQPLEGFGIYRVQTERMLLEQAEQGVSAMVIRLPPTVHGRKDAAFIASLVGIARKSGKSAYINQGQTRWPAVEVRDAAKLFRLALEKPIGGKVLHGNQEQGITIKSIATTIGKHLNLPVVSIASGDEADAHFGFFAALLNLDNPVSSDATQKLFGWNPTEQGLIADLDEDHYYATQTKAKFAY